MLKVLLDTTAPSYNPNPFCWYKPGRAPVVDVCRSGDWVSLRLYCGIRRANPHNRESDIFPCSHSEVNYFYIVQLQETLYTPHTNNAISISKWNIHTPWDQFVPHIGPAIIPERRLSFTFQNAPQSNPCSLLSSSFDRVMSSAKITLSTPGPQEMECPRCRRFNQREVKEQITDNMPLPRVLAYC